MTAYYVDNVTGNNGDSGLTPAAAWLTITFAVANVVAGDNIRVVNTGVAYTDSLTMSVDGTAALPITLRPEDYDDPPIISMNGTWELDTDWWVIDGFIFDNWANITAITFGVGAIAHFCTISNSHFRHNDAPAAKFADAFRCVIEDCWFTDIRERVAGNDLNAVQWDDGDSDACIVRRCNFEDIGSDGIQINPSVMQEVKRAQIIDCAFWVNRPYAATTRTWQNFSTNVSENGIDVKEVYAGNEAEIVRCLVYGFLPTVAGQDASGSSGEGIYVHNRSDAVSIENCTIHECERGISVTPSGGFTTCGIIARNNLVVDCIEYSIRANDAEEICVIENNTIIAATPAEYFTIEGTTVVLSVRNNYIQGGDFTRGVGITGEANFDYNAWDGPDAGPPAQWVGGNDPAIVAALLDSEYQPLAGSDLLAAGLRWGRIRDQSWRPRPDPPSVGCFEQNTNAYDLNLDGMTMYRWYDAISDADHEIFMVPGAEANLWRYATYIKDTTAHYLEYDLTAGKSKHLAFYIEPAHLAMASGDEFVVARLLDNAVSTAAVELHYDGANYRIAAYIQNDAAASTYVGAAATGFSLGDNERHLIEVQLFCAANPGDNDGSLYLWIDGVLQGFATNIDNDTLEPDKLQFGAVAGLDAGTGDAENWEAVFYMDTIRVSIGATIGPRTWTMPDLPIADQVLGIVYRVAGNTALGFQDITTSKLGGRIPSMAYITATWATADGVSRDGASFCIGAATRPSEQWSVAVSSEDGVSPSDTARVSYSDACLSLLTDAGALDGQAAFFSFISEGMRIEWINALASASLITVVFITAEMDAYANFVELGNVGVDADIILPLFEPDAILFATQADAFDDPITTKIELAFGVSVNGGNQAGVSTRSSDAVNPTQIGSRIEDAYVGGEISGTATIDWQAEISGYAQFGFTATPRVGNAGGDGLAYLAFALRGQAEVWAGVIDTPAGVGNQSQTGAAFEPQLVICGQTQMTAVNTAVTTGDAGSYGLLVFDDTDIYNNSIQDEDGQVTADSKSLSDNAITLPNDDGSAGFAGSFVGFIATGWTWNYTNTKAAKWWALAIELPTAAPVPPVPPGPAFVPSFSVTSSHHQSLGLSVLAFKPTIGSYIVRGTLVDDQLASKMSALSFEKHADGGWWSAQVVLNARLTDAERWFEEGLNLNIEIYNPGLERIFRGFVNQVDLSAGSLSATRGPLLDVVNRISMTYTPLLDATLSTPAYGSTTSTLITENADSQSRYGILEKVFSAEPGRCLPTLADQQQATFLEELKDPVTSEDAGFSMNNVTKVVLNILGYRHRLNTYIHQNTTGAYVQLSTKIQQALASDPNGLFSTDYSKIDLNAFLVNQLEDDNNPAGLVINNLVEIGGAVSNNRYLFGIYDNERAVYNAIPTTAMYQHRILDKFRRIERYGSGALVRPWDVQPGQFLFFPDFLIGRTQPADLRKDPRYLFIESVSFSTPYDVKINGVPLSTIPQLLAKARMLE